MKILYLWAEEYKVLKNINLCFDGKYNFNHEIKEDNKESNLYIEKNPLYTNKERNMSCIVGKNGSGKTTALKLIGKILNIYSNFLEYYSNYTLYNGYVINDIGNFILILEDENDELLFFSNLHLKNTKLFKNILIPKGYEPLQSNIPFLAIYFIEKSTFENKNSTQIKYQFIHEKIKHEEYTEKSHKEIKYEEKSIKSIYHFGKMEELDFLGRERGLFWLDISTNAFLHRDNEYTVEFKGNDRIFIYSIENIKRHLNVYFENQDENIDKKRLLLQFLDSKEMIRNYYGEEKKESREKIIELCNKVLDKCPIKQSNNYEMDIIDTFNKGALASFLIFNISNKNYEYLEKIEKILNKIKAKKSIYFISKFIALFYCDFNYSKNAIMPIIKTIKEINKILNDLKNIFDKFSKNIVISNENEKIEHKKILIFMKKCYSLTFNKFFNSFFPKWLDMNSGELARNDIFSRILYSKEYNNAEMENINNLIFLFDEIDLNLHPEWQRQIVKDIVKFIEEKFKGKKVQIILSTHSPIILSDFESKNVIFLKDGMSEKPDFQTFGQNIHTLFRSSFFLDSTIGEFASKQIKDVIQDLTHKTKEELEKDTKRKEEIEYIISIIGEPIIKRKLELMYKELFSESIEHYKEVRRKLIKEKEIIEGKIESKELSNMNETIKLLDRQIKELDSKIGDKND